MVACPPYLSRSSALSVSLLCLCLFIGCGGKANRNGGDGDGDGPGDGDGDGPGDGDGDVLGDGDGDGDLTTPFIEQISTTTGTQLDLLFVIDNSQQMADKQALLASAVPQLLERLSNPPVGTGFNDFHIGVITSSLGSAGATTCPRGDLTFNYDDQAHLIPSVRSTVDDPGLGFLTWSDTGDGSPAFELSGHIQGAGEVGCGLEAPLEAMYRFLVDPAPPEEVVLNQNSRSEPMGTDQTVLAQRDAFLRPESTVGIVILSDENDCSIMTGGAYYNNAGFGYLTGEPTFEMPLATSACEENPNDACCFSCLQASSPLPGCESYASECASNPIRSPENDRINVRCLDQKRRLGVDLLFPTQRYVDALTSSTIIDARSGDTVNNPLFRGGSGTPQRQPGSVFVLGIVGVPWQDLATDESLSDPAIMAYRTPEQLGRRDVETPEGLSTRWEVILGDPGLAEYSNQCQDDPSLAECGTAPVLPLDPFMIESIDERPAGLANPITGDIIVASTSTDPQANSINGHEYDNTALHLDGAPARDNLQYACIFPLETPKVSCTEDDVSCECGSEPDRNRPVCQPPAGGPAATSQYYAKAYPSPRILRLIQELGPSGLAASICPKLALSSQGPVTDPNFGYNPAMVLFADALVAGRGARCLPRELPTDSEGRVSCDLIETAAGLDCARDGRRTVSSEVEAELREHLQEIGRCSGAQCEEFEICAIEQLTGTGRSACLQNEGNPDSFDEAGFCYIDPSLQNAQGDYIAGGDDSGESPLVAACPPTARRTLRLVGNDTPTPGAITFVSCSP